MRKELNVYVLNEKWKQRMDRMRYERLLRKIFNYNPRGTRDMVNLRNTGLHHSV